MSYILDALRKADAQRDRQRLPGLQAHPSASDAPPARDMAGMGYAIGGVLLVGVLSAGVALWQGLRQEPAPVVAAPAPAPAPVVAAPAPVAPAPAPAPEPARAIVPAAPIVVEVPAPPPPPARPAAAVAAAAAPAAQPPVNPAPQAPAARAAAPATTASASAPAAIAAGAPAGAPAIAVSGGVYSPSPAQRLLIVNGQVFNEGSEVAPGVTLEQVERGRAVLNFRGQRFTLPY